MKKMKSYFKFFIAVGFFCGGAYATPSQEPLFLVAPVKPIMMFNMSKDHQLFFKLYDDYSDIDEDGVIDTTYNNNFDYYGYFDSTKCYVYDTTDSRFKANITLATNHYCQLTTDTTNYWSGNFLNWASMTRIDAIRKILYGGTRSTDTAALTVLERAFLPNDAHSFAKWYGGSDLRRLTPFDGSATNVEDRGLTLCNTSEPTSRNSYSQNATDALPLIRLAKGNYSLWASNERWQCRWNTGTNANNSGLSKIYAYSSAPANDTLNITTTASIVTDKSGKVTTNGKNVTFESGDGFNGMLKNKTIKIGTKNYTIASVTNDGALLLTSKASNSKVTNLDYSYSDTQTVTTVTATNTEMVARVEVCKSTSLSVNEQCKPYQPTTGSSAGLTIHKPTGLLQEYNNRVNFGLMMGSYRNNKSGGILRKIVGPIDTIDSLNDYVSDEITDEGFFKVPSTSKNSIIKSLDLLRIYGYNFSNGNGNSNGTYSDARNVGGDDCPWALGSFNDEYSGSGSGRCSNWGNPQAEIFMESLRYLAGIKSPKFDVDDSTFIADLNSVSSWNDPITSGVNGNFCAPLNVLQFNASTTSYDSDNLDLASDISSSFTDVGIKAKTSALGVLEGVENAQFFIGENSANNDQLCTAKDINSTTGGLGAVLGICSEAPRLKGGYNIAGLAYLARSTGIGATREKVKTHGVVLSPAIPSISIPVPGVSGKSVTILPACRNKSINPESNCAIVDFKVVSGPTLSGSNYVGSLYVNWEDSEQGGDYDQDMWGMITYTVSSSSIDVKTQVVADSTGNAMGFGYVISGTENDGFHVHSGIHNFSYTDTTSGILGCTSCNTSDAATTQNYIIGDSTAKTLKNPLYYAAKWGGYAKDTFTDADISATDPTNETYFYATNPAKLKSAMDALFKRIAGVVGSASTVAANSTSSQGDTHVYQARFDSEDWSGQLLDFGLTQSGVSDTSDWDTHVTMDRSSGFLSTRKVYTYDGATPGLVELTDANVDLTDDTVLNNNVPTLTGALKLGTEADYSMAIQRIKWLRGDAADEGTFFRVRTHLLGDIINSDPGYAGANSQRHNNLPGVTAFGASSYLTYVATKSARRKMVFVGANDGMLHAFDASNGKEIFAYIPRGVFGKLALLSEINYSHQYSVDGPVYVSDYYRQDGTWGTIVAGTLGSGGRGVYALDVTDVLNSTTTTAPTVIFDISDNDTSTAQPNVTLKNDIGYSGSKVLVLPVNNVAASGGGRWMAFFSNGTESVNDRAKLIGIDVNDPTTFVSIDTGVSANGLSPAAYLPGSQNVVTSVYAGDIMGNMWKFDVSNQDYNSWGVAYNDGGTPTTTPLPLINVIDPSGNPQPITAEPTLGLNSLKPLSGQPSLTVYFATGKYADLADNTDTSIQSIYAIADSGSPIIIDTTNRTTLLHEKWIDSETSGARDVLNDKTNSTTSLSPAVDWATKDGWFMDMVVKSGGTTLGTQYGERVLSKPLLINDRLIVNTFIPSTDQCAYGGNGWLMELVGVGDRYVNHSVLGDLANTQLSRPIISDLVPFQAGQNILILGSNLGSKKDGNGDANDTITVIEGSSADGARGRMSWRQIK